MVMDAICAVRLLLASDAAVMQGYAWAEDKEHCEEYGRLLQADPSKVSQRAKKRGLPQVHEVLVTILHWLPRKVSLHQGSLTQEVLLQPECIGLQLPFSLHQECCYIKGLHKEKFMYSACSKAGLTVLGCAVQVICKLSGTSQAVLKLEMLTCNGNDGNSKQT